MKKLFLLFIGLSVVMPNFIVAKPNPFPYTSSGNIPAVVTLHDQYTVTYTINPVVPLQTPIVVELNTTTPNFTKTVTCKRDQQNHIIQCSIVIHFNAGNLGDQSAELIAYDLNFPIFDIKLHSIVKQKGHFIYLKSGQPINALNLGPNDNGTIRLKNSGGLPISNVQVDNLNRAGFSNINCPTTSSKLVAGGDCIFSYQIDATPNPESFAIKATGNGADPSTLSLPVHIASAGHLVFSQRGLMLTALNLGPNTSGEVTLTNTGGSAVTNLMVSHLTEPGFSNLNCGTILAPGDSCQFSYATGSAPTGTSFTIIARGRGVDNNALPLPVKITSLGHFEFRQNGKLLTTLNLKQHDKGTIKLYNTGDTVISDILMSDYNQEDPDFIVFGCLGGQYPKGARFSLKPHQFCKIEYYIGTYAKYDKDMSFAISAQGENVDNNPTLLNINISKE